MRRRRSLSRPCTAARPFTTPRASASLSPSSHRQSCARCRWNRRCQRAIPTTTPSWQRCLPRRPQTPTSSSKPTRRSSRHRISSSSAPSSATCCRPSCACLATVRFRACRPRCSLLTSTCSCRASTHAHRGGNRSSRRSSAQRSRCFSSTCSPMATSTSIRRAPCRRRAASTPTATSASPANR